MKSIFSLVLIVLFFSYSFGEKKTYSATEVELIQLQKEIESLQQKFDETENHLKELQEEKQQALEKLIEENEDKDDLRYDKIDGRITTVLWVISIAAVLLGFVGYLELRRITKSYLEKQTKKLTKKRLDAIITDEWLRERIEEESQKPIEDALEQLKEEYSKLSKSMIEEERERITSESDELLKGQQDRYNELEKGIKKLLDDKSLQEFTPEEKEIVSEFDEVRDELKKEKDFTELDWFTKAYESQQKGNNRQAIIEYTKVIELDPKEIAAYNNRGNVKKSLEDYEGAIEDYDKAIELNTEDAVVYNNRGNAKSNLKDYEGAIEDYDKTLELNPEYAEAYNNRGVAKSDLGDYEGAIEDYDKALELNFEYANAYGNYAHTIILHKQDFDKAEVLINQSFQYAKKLTLLSELWFYRYAHYKKWQEEAERELKKLIEKQAKSLGWNLKDHVAIAKRNGHSNVKQMEAFAKAISE